MTTGIGSYVVPDLVNTSTVPGTVETSIVVRDTVVNIGNTVTASAETYNGTIPGPTFRLNRGNTVIVRLRNELEHPTGIHWHGIELANSADGTEVTQEAAAARFPVAPPLPAPPGGTYLYKFTVPRPGLYWYHPHHHHSTNRVFKGLYGMIVVADPHEAALIDDGVIPGAAATRQIVLSDITVCKAPGMNDPATYPSTLPWAGGPSLPAQPAPTPQTLCEIPPVGSATTDHGTPAATAYAAGTIPSIIRTGRTNEGQTVLTNGMNVGGRAGSPSAPGALAAGAQTLDVLAGQGLRLQIANCATIRYFRLILTTSTGMMVPLVRIGGEGGLLDNALVEGGVAGTLDTKYTAGEILLAPGSRADVVAAIPAGATGVLTLWTQDYQRTGAASGWSNLPTVPVMHLNVTGPAAETYAIAAGTPLRAAIAGAAVETLGPPDAVLLDPPAMVPPKTGVPLQDIRITTAPLGIDGVVGNFEGFSPYSSAPHIASSRFAEQGRTLELTVTNSSNAHHPFHLHGFSFQPLSLTPRTGAPAGTTGSFTWPYREFRDNVDIPGHYTLRFRVRLDDRALEDGSTPGGAFGRWLFHCHIFFHHHQGMISELVVTSADGSERPHVDVGGSWAYAPVGGTATRSGTFRHPDGDPMTLTASRGTVSPAGPGPGGGWTWSYVSAPGETPFTEYVYITARDTGGRSDQAVFRLKIGAPDDGADNGDPHIHTVDGKRYDFQAVGEFTLLRDSEGMEVQARQAPVTTAAPITDPYSGLTACVSLNTAVAAAVGRHRISWQPGPQGRRLQLYVDGKPAELSSAGLDLNGHRVSAFEADGATGLRVDYAHHVVLMVTPLYWNSHDMWYLNISVSFTQGDTGIMGSIPHGTWLPLLPSGASLGPMPESLPERYATLYRVFADAWRVSDATSLFVYVPGTTTATFTDTEWPAQQFPCKVDPRFEVPGLPPAENIGIEEARRICHNVSPQGLHADCVFDVAATGDPAFARHYLLAQQVRQRSTAVQIAADKARTACGEALAISVTVLPLGAGLPTPSGTVTFLIDGLAASEAVALDEQGRARFTTACLKSGRHRIRAAYSGNRQQGYDASSSPNVLHFVAFPIRGATLRRFLRFLNAARAPADLAAPPPNTVALFEDGRTPGAAHGIRPAHGHGSALFDHHTAEHILADRDSKLPLYGFARLQDLLEVEHFRPQLLDQVVPSFGPHLYGEWEVSYGGTGTPYEAAHAALLRTGQVLFMPKSSASADTLLWNPADPGRATALRLLSGPATGLAGSLAGSAHCFLPDGKLLAVGGGAEAAGSTGAWKFDPVDETWRQTPGPMAAARRFPATVVLGDDPGRVLVAGGGPATMEIYSESDDAFLPVTAPAGDCGTAAERAFGQSPGLHLLPGGALFYTRTGDGSGTTGAALFTFATPGSGSWVTLPPGADGADRPAGMSLLLNRRHPTEPDKILVIGGGDHATAATVAVIDNPASSAAWLTAPFPDGRARRGVNGVLLPDGKVLICGGLPGGGMAAGGGACYLYDPAAGNGSLSEMAEMNHARQQHSVAILLPSGKVMATGGGSPSIELFSPPYLFDENGTPASRPVIDACPDPEAGAVIVRGASFTIRSAQAPDIAQVVLVRPMAVTRQTDAEQRVLSLPWTLLDPATLSVTVPDGRVHPYAQGGGHTYATAPAGYYMVFIITGSGVPSEARFLRLV